MNAAVVLSNKPKIKNIKLRTWQSAAKTQNIELRTLNFFNIFAAMFGKKDNVASFGPGLVLNLVGEGTEIKGNINCDSDIRIDGKVVGNVITKSKLVLGTSGTIDGDVAANSIDISGNLKGNLTATDIVFLKAAGRIDGNIVTSKMVIESGGEFNGTCQMHGQ